MDTPNDNAEALRAATTPRAECGWGCFCDACWVATSLGEERLRRDDGSRTFDLALSTYDALWSLSFDASSEHAQALQEARSLLDRSEGSDGP